MTGLRGIAALVVLAGALSGVSTIGMAAGDDAEEAPAVFTEAYLNDPANIEVTNMDGNVPYVLGFAQDAAGEVYVLTSITTGPSSNLDTIYKIVPSM